MKKKSILMTCIVAVMALAMFVGCDNAQVFPDMPQSVKSGYIDQIGDFLTGQAYDPDKFTVMAVLDNGSEQEVSGTIIDFGGNVNSVANGDSVSAFAGYSYDGSSVPAYGSLKAYTITRLEVTGPESYVYKTGFDIPSSDLTVTAYYLDSENVEKSMVLSSTEFDVGMYAYADGVKPAASRPEVATIAVVTPKVGYAGGDPNNVVTGVFSFTSTFVPASEELPGDITALASVDVSNIVLPAYKYENVPQPNFEDVEIKVFVDGQEDGATPFTLTADPGVKMYYTVNNGLKLSNTDLTTLAGQSLYVAVELDGCKTLIATDPVTIQKVKLDISATGDEVEFVEKTALAAPSASDFAAEARIGSGKPYIFEEITSGVEYKYYVTENGGTTYVEYTGKTVPAAGTTLYVAGTYMGVTSNYVEVGTTKEAKLPVPAEIVDVGLVDTYNEPAHQRYSVVPSVNSSVLKSLTVVNDDKTESVLEAEDFAGKVSVRYSATNGKYTAITADLEKVDEIYIEVSYRVDADTVITGYKAVQLVEPIATDLSTLSAEYVYVYNNSQDTPMVDSKINWTILAVNAEGSFAYDGDVDVYVDGYPVAALPEFVEEEAISNVRVKASLTQSDGSVVVAETTNAVNVPAGKGYVSGKNIKVTISEGYVPLFGDVLSTEIGSYTIDAESFDIIGELPDVVANNQAQIKGIKLPITGARVDLENTGIIATVTYLGNEGKVVTKNIPVEDFAGIQYTETDSISLVSIETGCSEVAEGKLYYGKTYDLTKFTYDSKSIKEHNDDPNLKLKGYCKGTYEAGKTELSAITGTLMDNYAGTYNFVFEYTNTDGKVTEKVIQATLEDAPNA